MNLSLFVYVIYEAVLLLLCIFGFYLLAIWVDAKVSEENSASVFRAKVERVRLRLGQIFTWILVIQTQREGQDLKPVASQYEGWTEEWKWGVQTVCCLFYHPKSRPSYCHLCFLR